MVFVKPVLVLPHLYTVQDGQLGMESTVNITKRAKKTHTIKHIKR